jgi:hypothetical protein
MLTEVFLFYSGLYSTEIVLKRKAKRHYDQMIQMTHLYCHHIYKLHRPLEEKEQ